MLDTSRSDLCAGVAGAGTMGRGIAQVLAQCGARTLLYDAQPGAARKGKEAIAAALGKLTEKGRLAAADAQAALGRIEVVESLEAFAPCQVVVEAIVEDLAVKQQLFQLDRKTRVRAAAFSRPTRPRSRSRPWPPPASARSASPATTSSTRCRC